MRVNPLPRASASSCWPRRARAICCWVTLLACAGCMTFGNGKYTAPPPNQPLLQDTPKPEQLISYLNKNSARIVSLESRDLDLDIKAGTSSFGVRGTLFCQKPKNFRLRAKLPALGKEVADFGSNNQEFWYWISEDRPPDLYYCSYTDLARGNVAMPFPLNPEWVLEALGVSAPEMPGTPEQEQARGRQLDVRKVNNNQQIELIERTRSSQGQTLTKVTVLNNFNSSGTTPQVVSHRLYDSRNQLLCQSTMIRVQYDQATGAVIPYKLEIKWPMQQLTLFLTLGEVAVNNPELARNPKLFTRPQMRNVREVDLARASPFAQPAGIQRTGAHR